MAQEGRLLRVHTERRYDKKMRFLTEEDIKFKGVEYYYKLKPKFNRDGISHLYETKLKFGSSIGYVAALMKRLDPSSAEDAYNLYFASGRGDKHLGPYNRGRDENEFEDLALEWQAASGRDDIPLVEFFDALALHAIIETYDGFKYEKQAKDLLDASGFKTRWPEKDEDGKYFVDIIAEKDGVLYFIQIKPKSFFSSTLGHTTSDRISAFGKMKAAKKDFGNNIIYKYLIYDKDTGMWIVNEKNGRCAFDYEELVADDGRGTFLGDIKKMVLNESYNLFNRN